MRELSSNEIRCPGNVHVCPPLYVTPPFTSSSTMSRDTSTTPPASSVPAANNDELMSDVDSYICGTSHCRRSIFAILCNGVWCYSCEQWYHFNCQGMKSMNSPEAQKWMSPDKEFLCF